MSIFKTQFPVKKITLPKSKIMPFLIHYLDTATQNNRPVKIDTFFPMSGLPSLKPHHKTETKNPIKNVSQYYVMTDR